MPDFLLDIYVSIFIILWILNIFFSNFERKFSLNSCLWGIPSLWLNSNPFYSLGWLDNDVKRFETKN